MTETTETTAVETKTASEAADAPVQIQPRLTNPGELLPGVMEAVQGLIAAARKGGVPEMTMELVHLRASQINGCSFCVDYAWRGRKKADEETALKLFAVSAWREAPYFTAVERAALALAECVTRLSDRPDPVPDEVWNEAARHYNDKELAGLVLSISLVNVWNRCNVTTRQVAGAKWR